MLHNFICIFYVIQPLAIISPLYLRRNILGWATNIYFYRFQMFQNMFQSWNISGSISKLVVCPILAHFLVPMMSQGHFWPQKGHFWPSKVIQNGRSFLTRGQRMTITWRMASLIDLDIYFRFNPYARKFNPEDLTRMNSYGKLLWRNFKWPVQNFQSLYSSFIENGLFSGAVLGSVFEQKLLNSNSRPEQICT